MLKAVWGESMWPITRSNVHIKMPIASERNNLVGSIILGMKSFYNYPLLLSSYVPDYAARPISSFKVIKFPHPRLLPLDLRG